MTILESITISEIGTILDAHERTILDKFITKKDGDFIIEDYQKRLIILGYDYKLKTKTEWFNEIFSHTDES